MADTAGGPLTDRDLLRLVLSKVERVEDVLGSIVRRVEAEVRDRTAEVAKERSRRRWSFVAAAVLLIAVLAIGAGGVRTYQSNQCQASNRARVGTRTAIDSTLRTLETVTDDDTDRVIEQVIERNDRVLDHAQPIRECGGIWP